MFPFEGTLREMSVDRVKREKVNSSLKEVVNTKPQRGKCGLRSKLGLGPIEDSGNTNGHGSMLPLTG